MGFAAHMHMQDEGIPQMKGPLTASLIVHGAVLLLALIGLPHITPDLPPVPQAVSIELATISELTQTNKPPSKATKSERKETPKPKERPPAPPKNTSDAPPDLTKPTPPQLKEMVAESRVPVPPELPARPEKAKEKVEPKPKEKQKPQTDQAFNSLLKNWAEPSPTEVQETPTDEKAAMLTDPEPAPENARFSDQLTMSEEDALRHQLSQCWNVMAGAKQAEDLVVEVRLFVNPDRTVQDARILDESRYNRDTFFRAAADSALRAVRNPRCTPLNLPVDKYEEWKVMTVRFDPRDML